MKSSPGFSVILPTHNRLAGLNACLGGLAAQDYSRDRMQVIVVNDGGVEIPQALQKAWEKELNLLVVHCANAGPAVARNIGARYAAHEWLAFIDDDCVPAPDWLTQLGGTLAVYPEAVVGGETRNGLPDNVYAEASQSLVLFLLEYYHRGAGKHTQSPFFTSNNLALGRHVLERVGGFDMRLRHAEERDLCARLVAAGYALRYVPAARVVHYRPMNLHTFWKQHTAYGKGAFHYRQNRQCAGERALRPEPARFYWDMLWSPWRTGARQPLPVAACIVIAQVANAYGFFRARRANSFSGRKSL